MEAEATQFPVPPRDPARPQRHYFEFIGRRVFSFFQSIHGVGAFALITLGVLLKKSGVARRVIRPLIAREIHRAGVRMLPMFLFAAIALGLLVIGQTIPWITRVEAAQNFLG